jgi:hypothetical protein
MIQDAGYRFDVEILNSKHEIPNKSKIQISNVPNGNHEERKE